MVAVNATRNAVLAAECARARTFIARLRGLMFKKALPAGHGLLIEPCNSIHMFFVRFPIDAVFINANGIVEHIEEGIKPWKVSRLVPRARRVLELPAGTVSASGTQVGDRLEFV